MLRSRSTTPQVLRGATSSCRIRPWTGQPSVAQLVVFNQGIAPTAGDVDRWVDELHRLGYAAVRTGALNELTGAVVRQAGFGVRQELELLEHRSPATAGRPEVPSRRLPDAERQAAVAVDRAAFETPWQLDEAAFAEVCNATVRHRARAVDSGGSLAGFAISGRDGRLGFLQRLAVHPAHRREGLGAALVVDSLRWLARWRATRVLVNTHVENVAALTLYHRLGFVSLPERLAVYERSLR